MEQPSVARNSNRLALKDYLPTTSMPLVVSRPTAYPSFAKWALLVALCLVLFGNYINKSQPLFLTFPNLLFKK